MLLEFPGTRGEIEEESEKHRYHSSIVVNEGDTSILIDFGEKHPPYLRDRINDFNALLITHAHPDHYIWTLREEKEVKIPVYLTEVTLNYGQNKPVNYHVIVPEESFELGSINVVAYEVIHSLRCPAVCYKLKGSKVLVYAPDIVDIGSEGDEEKSDRKRKVFENVDILIADGSSLDVNMVRRKDNKLFGHARIKTIVGWCKKYRIGSLIITHCGKQLVTIDEKELQKKLYEYAEGKVDIRVAYDGYIEEI
ncbi:MAG: MBL fold metallo-hydrolase [Actinobacteria bacterium]|nr:MBL fold metallo-hydrolase [Actinomycetota bacterium]